MKLRFLKAFALAIACLFLTLAGAVADVLADEKETWLRINLAGTQRMLAQQIGRSTCYVMTGLETERFAREATEAARAFELNSLVLVKGGSPAKLRPELDPKVRSLLKNVDETWAAFGPAARQIMAGDFHAVPMRQFLHLDPVLLSRLDAAAKVIEQVYKDKLVARKRLASTINIASKQQMLIMKISKLYCHISLDIARGHMLSELARASAEFEDRLAAMETGDFDLSIVDPPSLAALAKLMDLRNTWIELQAHLQSLAEAPANSKDGLLSVAALADTLNAQSGELVQIYLN